MILKINARHCFKVESRYLRKELSGSFYAHNGNTSCKKGDYYIECKISNTFDNQNIRNLSLTVAKTFKIRTCINMTTCSVFFCFVILKH